jgi:hypothetical protein
MAKAMGIGIDAVTEWFTTNVSKDEPYYSVWQGRNLVFSSKDEDFEKALNLLEDNLRACEQNQYDELLTIKIHHIAKSAKNLIITDKTPVIATYTFRVVANQGGGGYMQPYNQGVAAVNYSAGTTAILEKLNGIDSRLTAIENDEDDEDDEDVAATGAIDVKDGFYALLNNLLSDPEVKSGIVNFIKLGVAKILPMNTNNNVAVAGIPDYDGMDINKKVETAINVIAQHRPQIVDDLVGLAKIAQTDPNKLQLIMSMLPK